MKGAKKYKVYGQKNLIFIRRIPTKENIEEGGQKRQRIRRRKTKSSLKGKQIRDSSRTSIFEPKKRKKGKRPPIENEKDDGTIERTTQSSLERKKGGNKGNNTRAFENKEWRKNQGVKLFKRTRGKRRGTRWLNTEKVRES